MAQRMIKDCADGLSFTPIRGRALSRGYYVARRRTWAAEYSWQVVFVYALDDDRTKLGVFQVGSEEPENPLNWVFRSRLTGLEHMPSFLPPRAKMTEAIRAARARSCRPRRRSQGL